MCQAFASTHPFNVSPQIYNNTAQSQVKNHWWYADPSIATIATVKSSFFECAYPFWSPSRVNGTLGPCNECDGQRSRPVYGWEKKEEGKRMKDQPTDEERRIQAEPRISPFKLSQNSPLSKQKLTSEPSRGTDPSPFNLFNWNTTVPISPSPTTHFTTT